MVSVPPVVIAQTAPVVEVKAIARPESELALSVGEKAPWGPGLAKVMVWGAFGIAKFDHADAVPVPTALVAVTLNVYVVPLARLVTVIEVHGAVQVPVRGPGDAVAV
jgi:hypothetical protein